MDEQVPSATGNFLARAWRAIIGADENQHCHESEGDAAQGVKRVPGVGVGAGTGAAARRIRRTGTNLDGYKNGAHCPLEELRTGLV